jgi:hypothetical protein
LGAEPSVALDIAGFAKAFAERGQIARCGIGRSGIDEADHRDRRLLRACRRHPRRRAKPRDELPPPHQSCCRSALRRDYRGQDCMGTGKHRANTEVMQPFSTGLGAMSHDLFSQRATGYIPTADCRFRGTAQCVALCQRLAATSLTRPGHRPAVHVAVAKLSSTPIKAPV